VNTVDPGGGEARHRLEERVDETRAAAVGLDRAEDEGQRAEDRQHKPDAGGEQEGLLDRQPRRDPVGAGKRQQQAEDRRDGGGLCEGAPMPVARKQVCAQRQQHREPQRQDKEAHHVAHGTHVEHGAEGWRSHEAVSSGEGPGNA
jgi:hypothetical protein